MPSSQKKGARGIKIGVSLALYVLLPAASYLGVLATFRTEAGNLSFPPPQIASLHCWMDGFAFHIASLLLSLLAKRGKN
jgi:hypothetical protein